MRRRTSDAAVIERGGIGGDGSEFIARRRSSPLSVVAAAAAAISVAFAAGIAFVVATAAAEQPAKKACQRVRR